MLTFFSLYFVIRDNKNVLGIFRLLVLLNILKIFNERKAFHSSCCFQSVSKGDMI